MQSSIYPEHGETQSQFAQRFHEAMRDVIPQTDARNAAMLHAWRMSGREDLDEAIQEAARRFDPTQYERVRDVPVFCEHSTKDRGGNLVVYDRAALEAIINRCNERICDTGNFAALTAGHTPTKEMLAAGAPMPEVLGYVGPFRLGMIGNKHPRWAIFADEYWQRGDIDRLKRLRRRSPEVWLEDRMEDRFMDPIAALGAEAPRLDMGAVRYAITSDGREIEKYSAASFPAATNVFVPGTMDSIQTEAVSRNAADAAPKGGSAMAELSPENVQQIVEALMATKPMQWVISQMSDVDDETEQLDKEAGDTDRTAPSQPAADTETQSAEAGAGVTQTGTDTQQSRDITRHAADSDDDGERDDEAEPATPEDEAEPATSEELADLDEAERREYSAFSPEAKRGYLAARRRYCSDRSKYSRRMEQPMPTLQARYSRLEAENKALRERIEVLERDAQAADRYSRLMGLVAEGYAIDPTEQMEHTADFSASQFDRHIDMLRRSSTRIPLASVVPPLYTPDLPSRSRNSKQLAADTQAAIDYATRMADEGKHVSYEEAIAHVTGARA